MSKCNLCPRKCGIDRQYAKGFCGESNDIRVARIAPHYFEEPPISGTRGSGTVFFSGCSLKCVFCQNKEISQHGTGKFISPDELFDAMCSLADEGVHNINLVTATHFAEHIIPVLERFRTTCTDLPIVYNSSGYENVETLKRLEGLIDIYLPDFKYFSTEPAQKYSCAPDYPETAIKAIKEMVRQTGRYKYFDSEPDLLKSGVIVRHLVLPSCRHDSINALTKLAQEINPQDVLISLMSQYTPDFALDSPYKELHRRVTAFEYSSVATEAERLGFDGFVQQKSSASAKFTPSFII